LSCEEWSNKACPERSEGTLEIAAGYALATTSSDCHACVPKLQFSFFVMPDLIRHPEALKGLDSGFRRNDTFFINSLLRGRDGWGESRRFEGRFSPIV
jgi:hypothetical protein